MKKTLIIILALIMILALGAGCGNANVNEADGANGAGVEADDENLRGSSDAFSAAAADIAGSTSLEDINIFDPDDDASFKGGESWASKDLSSASAN